jgi:poly(3-hydroxybutyrate) depolymerase
MAPERRALWQKASALATSAVSAEPIHHHRPVDLGVVRAVAKLAAPTLEALGVEVGATSLCEIGPQAVQYVFVEPDSTPESAPTCEVRLHGSVKAMQWQ